LDELVLKHIKHIAEIKVASVRVTGERS